MGHGEKPILLYDGECNFCKKWVSRWKNVTGEKIDYQPYQEAANTFPQISLEDCKKAVQLIMPDGTVYKAAEAIFRAAHFAGKQKWWLWFYKHIPGFALVSETIYKHVARRRRLL